MPALYAHNKFGKLVIPKLPSTIKETVRKYPNEFMPYTWCPRST